MQCRDTTDLLLLPLSLGDDQALLVQLLLHQPAVDGILLILAHLHADDRLFSSQSTLKHTGKCPHS